MSCSWTEASCPNPAPGGWVPTPGVGPALTEVPSGELWGSRGVGGRPTLHLNQARGSRKKHLILLKKIRITF